MHDSIEPFAHVEMNGNTDGRWRSSIGAMPHGARIAGVLLLAALVAVASRSTLEGGLGGESTAAVIATIVLLVSALTAIAIAGLSISGYALLGETRRRTKLAILAGALLLVPVVVALARDDTSATYRHEWYQWCQNGTVQIRRFEWAKDRGWEDGGYGGAVIETGRPCDDTGGGVGRVARRGGAGGGDASLLVAAVGGTLLALLIAAVIVALVMRRRRIVSTAPTERDLVRDALDESLDDLRRERDIRRAIIACYARMERALDRAGSARRPAEAPFEYLVRILERITASGGAARALTELFEHAKFSVEPMGERDKQQAIGALEVLRAEVSRPL